MDNEKVRALALVMEQLYNMGSDKDMEMLSKAVYALYFSGEIESTELHWIVEYMQSVIKSKITIGNCENATGEVADQTVLWLRTAASGMETSFESISVAIQNAAEYLHDYWADIMD